ncbi:MAG: arginine--tRNA ligase [Flavobacteriales bacterium]
MNPLEQQLSEVLNTALQSLYSIDSPSLSFQKTRKEFEGNITLLVFPFVKQARKKPEAVAQELGDYLMEHSALVVGFNVVKGFLNLSISSDYWKQFLETISTQNQFGLCEAKSDSELVLVEFSSPNTNKPLHLGHIRNILLGSSVARILKSAGRRVKAVQVINDRGIHICKSMLAWQKFGEGETPETSGLKGDHLVGKYYVRFDQEYKKEMAELIENGMPEKQAKDEAPLLKEAKAMLINWENGDADTVALWKTMNQWVYQGFESTYQRMGIEFDQNYYESETYILGRDCVYEGLEKGLFFKKEDGSIWCDLSDEKMDEKILLRADGTSVYITQDIGTAIERHKDFGFNSMIYTVGDEQNHHFKVLFSILKKLNYDWAKHCSHLSYGMVDLPSGKMKSREGTVVDADELMQSMYLTAKAQGDERGLYEGVSLEEQDVLYEQIGRAALNYFILKVDPKKRMLFNPNESIDMQGNTGPFIQYAHARICSILRKYGSATADVSQVEPDEYEIDLLAKLHDYPQTIQQAAEEHSPAVIANYTYDLVKTFNHFYQNSPILSLEDKAHKHFKILVCKKVAETIQTATAMLGIDVPERM